MRIGLSQLRTTSPRLGSSHTQFRGFFFSAALAFAPFGARAALASRWSVMYTAATPDGSLARPPKPIRARVRVLTLRLTPLFVTVFVDVVMSPTVRFGRGAVMTTDGGVPSVIRTPIVVGGLAPPWRSTTTSCTATAPSPL